MRILFCVQNYFPALAFGGRVAKSTALAEGQVRLGHQVCVLTSNVMDLNTHPTMRGHSSVHNGVRVQYLGTWMQYRTASLNPGVILFCLSQLRRFDVVHIVGMYETIGAAVSLFASLCGVPYVLEPSGMLVPILRSFRKKAVYNALVGRQMAMQAQRVIATSDREATGIAEYGVREDKVVIRRNGVDLHEFETLPRYGQLRAKLGIASDAYVFLYLGRVCPIKQIEVLIDAFAQLRRPDSWLLVVGPDEKDGYQEFLKDVAARTGISARIRFTGPLYQQEKLEALVDADQFVMPSESESWGNAAAEAIAAGTPVIVTDRCGLAPFIRNRVGLVVPGNTTDIKCAMSKLMMDRSLYRSFVRSSVDVARDLSWEQPVKQMDGIYRAISKN